MCSPLLEVGIAGTNYLLPVDADLKSEMDVKLGSAINIDVTLDQTMGDAKVKLVFLDACRVGIARHLNHLDRRVINARYVAAARHGDPNLTRQLGSQFVELQRGQQAEHGLRRSGRHHHEAFVFRDRMAG